MTGPSTATSFAINEITTTDIVATANGTWDPLGIAPLTPTTMNSAAQQASEATRTLLGISPDPTQFHVIYTAYPNADVQRSLWRVEVTATGPSLQLNTTHPHASSLNLVMRLYPFTDKQQVVFDESVPEMPYRGVLSPCVAAILLRHWLGDASVDLTLPDYGTGRFTPEQLRFRDTFDWSTITVPYLASWNDLAGYELVAPPSVDLIPGMWLVATDENDDAVGWQVSYCVTDGERGVVNRWDEPQVTPVFVPLEWPPQPPWEW